MKNHQYEGARLVYQGAKTKMLTHTILFMLLELDPNESSTVTFPFFIISLTPVLLVPSSLRLPQARNSWRRIQGEKKTEMEREVH